MTEKILITAALPYANGSIHFGHIAGAYLPADVYSRFERLRGTDVLYICGSDEYGVAITLSADLAGRTPKEHVDYYHNMLSHSFQKLNISFDHYSRTTWEGHIEPTQTFFKDLLKNGYIEEKVTDQLYSEEDNRFLADRYVVGTCPKCGYDDARGDECPQCGASYEATDLKKPRSKLSNAPLTLKPTKQWFMRFDLFKEKLTDWISKKDWKPNVKQFAENYINDLKPRAITRDSEWGIPVPLEGAEGKVLYVWFDAPIGYISATKEWAERVKKDPEAWKEYWFDTKTKMVQFVGKDNIPFHAIFFPAMIMGQDLPYNLVDELPANEFYHLEGRQFSKSNNWFIDIESFLKTFSVDQIRYAIAANSPESQDSEFSWKDFQMRCNSELLSKYGNLVNRVLVFAAKNCFKKVPPLGKLEAIDIEFLQKVKEIAKECEDAYATFSVRKASQQIMELASISNTYFDAKKPWKGVKDDSLKEGMMTTIASCFEALKILALISSPIIPKTAEMLWKLLGFSTSLEEENWHAILNEKAVEGRELPAPSILFQRVEDETIEDQINLLKK